VKAGFSLIEIIVVTVIILLITGGVMVTTGDYKERQEQISTMGEVRSYVELARNYAITMQWPALIDTKQKYTRVDIGGTRMTITAVPDNIAADTMPFTSVSFSDVSLASSFCFTAYDAKVVDCTTGVGKTAEILINGDSGYKVLINENGQISQELP